MSIKETISNNFTPVVILIMLFAFILDSKRIPRTKKRFFVIAVIAFAFELIFRNLDLYTATLDYDNYGREISSCLGYIFRPLIIYIVLGVEFDLTKETQWKTYSMLSLPLILNTIMAVSVFFSEKFYYFDENNHFQRGPYGKFLFITGPLYLAVLIITIIPDIFIKKNLRRTLMGLSCTSLIVISVLMELFAFRELMSETAMVLAFLFYFMFFRSSDFNPGVTSLNDKSTHDELTNAFNRAGYELLVQRYTNDGTVFGMLIIRIDDYKKILERKDKETSQKVLVSVAEALKTAFRTSDYVIRLENDEFVVLLPGLTPDLDFVAIKKMNAVNDDFINSKSGLPSFSLSSGLAFSDNGIDNDLYRRAKSAFYHSVIQAKGTCSIDGKF